MASPLPHKTVRWTVDTDSGGLRLETDASIPPIGDEDVLVKLYAASLNYRELVILKGGAGPVTNGIIPGSDGSGVVIAIGSAVSAFKPGDKVVTHLAPSIDDEAWPDFSAITAGLGQQINGTLCQYGVFTQRALVPMPSRCTVQQACTLTCSALTAWNALFGLEGRALKKGDWVLTQGTGGVSVAALQFAVASGAHVIATTSSDEKAQQLREFGATHVINYKYDSSWGTKAKDFTPMRRGLDFVIDVGGDGTLGQSLKAVRQNGIIAAAGMVASTPNERPALMDVLWKLCLVRGVLLGTRKMYTEMNGFIDEQGVDLALDDEVFDLKNADRAYEKLRAQRHFAKIVIQIL